MTFADLLPGVLARIPDAPDPWTIPEPGLPPAVKILTPPIPCSNPTCAAVQLLAREVDGGAPVTYHRLPHRAVIHITPALEAS
ncbi:hypothetical protein [Streptosporangium sp. G12]